MSKQSTSPWSTFDLGLVTIEFESPFLIGASEADQLHDEVFVTDANGLPCIPGPTLAGILRHALASDEEGRAAADQLFGFQAADGGEASRLRVSFASVHGADDRPVPFRGARSDDPVLAFLKAGAARDHVRIDMRGVADGRGKFDVLAVPAGARFSFELMVSHDSGQRLADVLALLGRAELRVGRHGRSGLGRFKVVRALGASFDLAQAADIRRLGEVPVALEQQAGSKALKPLPIATAKAGSAWAHAHITLVPIGTWVVGGGTATGREPASGRDREWGRLPLAERRVTWTRRGETEVGAVVDPKQAPYVIPGSSIKGVLRHRTAFHARRLAGAWLEAGMADPAPTEAEHALFGSIRDEDAGEPGRVFCADSQVAHDTPIVALNHVSLDRFTQGPMDHLLFDELALGEARIELRLAVRLDAAVDATARRALIAAVDDLCAGRLALGAGRGHGRFRGKVTWTGAPLLQEEVAACR